MPLKKVTEVANTNSSSLVFPPSACVPGLCHISTGWWVPQGGSMLHGRCQEEWNADSGCSPLGLRTYLGTLWICLSLALEVPSGVLMRNHKVPPCPMTQRAVSPTLGLSGPHFQLVGSLWQPPMNSTIEEPAPNSFKLLQTANGVIFTPLR